MAARTVTFRIIPDFTVIISSAAPDPGAGLDSSASPVLERAHLTPTLERETLGIVDRTTRTLIPNRANRGRIDREDAL
jgi:hypothetical protein